MESGCYQRTHDLMEAELGAELLALDAEAGHCFGFNSVATAVWRLLDQPKSFDDIRSALLAEYDVEFEQCTTELGELLDDLQAKGLVTLKPLREQG